MTTLIVCALIAVIMPYVARIPAIFAMNKLGGYDNKHPRQQQSQLTGLGARAVAAHQNCFESLAIFALALAVVLGSNNVNAVTETLAMTHIVARILFCVFYWLNLDIVRSITWLVGVGTAIAMIAVSL